MHDMKKSGSRTFSRTVIYLSIFVMATIQLASFLPAGAAICVFRFPDREVYRLFPDAISYKTIEVRLAGQYARETEKLLGARLDESDLGKHKFYLIHNKGKLIGIIHPHSELGSYGTIEMLWAIDTDGRIVNFLIQRSREKQTHIFTKKTFSRRFAGLDLDSAASIRPETRSFPKRFSAGLENNKDAVWPIVFGAKKTLAIVKVFFGNPVKPEKQ